MLIMELSGNGLSKFETNSNKISFKVQKVADSHKLSSNTNNNCRHNDRFFDRFCNNKQPKIQNHKKLENCNFSHAKSVENKTKTTKLSEQKIKDNINKGNNKCDNNNTSGLYCDSNRHFNQQLENQDLNDCNGKSKNVMDQDSLLLSPPITRSCGLRIQAIKDRLIQQGLKLDGSGSPPPGPPNFFSNPSSPRLPVWSRSSHNKTHTTSPPSNNLNLHESTLSSILSKDIYHSYVDLTSKRRKWLLNETGIGGFINYNFGSSNHILNLCRLGGYESESSCARDQKPTLTGYDNFTQFNNNSSTNVTLARRNLLALMSSTPPPTLRTLTLPDRTGNLASRRAFMGLDRLAEYRQPNFLTGAVSHAIFNPGLINNKSPHTPLYTLPGLPSSRYREYMNVHCKPIFSTSQLWRREALLRKIFRSLFAPFIESTVHQQISTTENSQSYQKSAKLLPSSISHDLSQTLKNCVLVCKTWNRLLTNSNRSLNSSNTRNASEINKRININNNSDICNTNDNINSKDCLFDLWRCYHRAVINFKMSHERNQLRNFLKMINSRGIVEVEFIYLSDGILLEDAIRPSSPSKNTGPSNTQSSKKDGQFRSTANRSYSNADAKLNAKMDIKNDFSQQNEAIGKFSRSFDYLLDESDDNVENSDNDEPRERTILTPVGQFDDSYLENCAELQKPFNRLSFHNNNSSSLITYLGEVRHLVLRVCSLSETHFREIFKSTVLLDRIDFYGCNSLTESVLWSSSIPLSLKSIHLCDCSNVTNECFAAISHQLGERLINLEVQSYHVSDKISSYFERKSCPNLLELKLQHCLQLSHYGLSSIFLVMPQLVHLDLSGCSQVCDETLDVISTYLHALQILECAWCPSVSDAGLKSIASNVALLKRFVLDRCSGISDVGISYLTNLANLESISLRWCPGVNDVVISHIIKMQSLRELCITGCHRISKSGLGMLATHGSLTHLEVLNVTIDLEEIIADFNLSLPECEIFT